MMGNWHDHRIMTGKLLNALDRGITVEPESSILLAIANDLTTRSQELYRLIHLDK